MLSGCMGHFLDDGGRCLVKSSSVSHAETKAQGSEKGVCSSAGHFLESLGQERSSSSWDGGFEECAKEKSLM